jgi:hypothetical protein
MYARVAPPNRVVVGERRGGPTQNRVFISIINTGYFGFTKDLFDQNIVVSHTLNIIIVANI